MRLVRNDQKRRRSGRIFISDCCFETRHSSAVTPRFEPARCGKLSRDYAVFPWSIFFRDFCRALRIFPPKSRREPAPSKKKKVRDSETRAFRSVIQRAFPTLEFRRRKKPTRKRCVKKSAHFLTTTICICMYRVSMKLNLSFFPFKSESRFRDFSWELSENPHRANGRKYRSHNPTRSRELAARGKSATVIEFVDVIVTRVPRRRFRIHVLFDVFPTCYLCA